MSTVVCHTSRKMHLSGRLSCTSKLQTLTCLYTAASHEQVVTQKMQHRSQTGCACILRRACQLHDKRHVVDLDSLELATAERAAAVHQD